ncbi:MAG TPA: alpha/beta fold hydrolase [Vicinamibacterales bacterium]|jgi:hypothetical protein
MVHHIPGPSGRLEALVDDPSALCTTGTPGASDPLRPPRAVVVIAHPHPLHGGTMHTKIVFQVAKAFCRLGCAVLRFNFRGVGLSDGTFGEGAGEIEDFNAAVDFATARYPGIEAWAAGASFGSWVAMTAGAKDERIKTLIGLALPANLYDFSAAARSPKPKFVIHGEHDAICPLRAVRAMYATAVEPKELVVIEAANHLFDGRLHEVAEAIEDLLAPASS